MDDNIIRLEIPLKYPDTIRVTFVPDLPGPLVGPLRSVCYKDTQLPGLIDLDWIHGHLARTTVSVGPDRVKVWVTINLAQEVYLPFIYTSRRLTSEHSHFIYTSHQRC